MTQKELINIIATYLPVDEERAANIIDGINNGYALGGVDYIEALSSRDNAIEKLSTEIYNLKDELLDSYYSRGNMYVAGERAWIDKRIKELEESMENNG
jgi:hypothetical protein